MESEANGQTPAGAGVARTARFLRCGDRVINADHIAQIDFVDGRAIVEKSNGNTIVLDGADAEGLNKFFGGEPAAAAAAPK